MAGPDVKLRSVDVAVEGGSLHAEQAGDGPVVVFEAGSLPHVPVGVISGGEGGFMEKQRRQPLIAAHRAFAESLPRGRHVVAAASSHLVPLTEPDVVAEAVRSAAAESD